MNVDGNSKIEIEKGKKKIFYEPSNVKLSSIQAGHNSIEVSIAYNRRNEHSDIYICILSLVAVT